MAKRFQAQYDPATRFVVEDFLLSIAMFRDQGAVLTNGENCMVALYCVPLIYNAQVYEAHEQWMWIDPPRGKIWPALLDAIEAWGRDVGARWMNLGSIPWMRGDVVGRMYRGFGYEPSFNLYRKVL